MLTGKARQSPHRKKYIYHILILFGIGIIYILALIYIKPLYNVNQRLLDQLFISKEPSPNIIVAGIDDSTLEKYGVWSDWPRNLHSLAIQNLKQAGAGVIGFDVLFTDTSSDDEDLSATVADAGNVVFPSIGLECRPLNDGPVVYNSILTPTFILREAVAGTGHANITPDADGTVRRLPLIISDPEGEIYPAFGISILNTFFNARLPNDYLEESGVLHTFFGDIPAENGYFFRINFSPDNKERPYLSYADVIDNSFDRSMVENKIVLIGMTATGEYDKWTIPGSNEKESGVYIHALMIDNILNRQYLVRAGGWMDFLVMLLLLGVAAVSLPYLSLRWGGILISIVMVGFLIASFLCFENGYVIDILYPISVMPVIFVGNVIVRNSSTTIENARLNNEVSDGYKGTIRALAASIEAKDSYTRGHSHRVTEYALLTAGVLGISPEEMVILEYAGILHDIGKIGIPDNILTKPGSLTDEEFAFIREHPVIGANIINDVPFLNNVKKLVLYHHEKYDGTGYPEGLVAGSIPLGARIIAVADSYDSMTSDRAYRKAMNIEDAIRELKRCSGTQFCPVVTRAFLSALNDNINNSLRGSIVDNIGSEEN